MDVNIEGLYVRSGIISTYTGKYLDTRDPQPDQICIEDIAHQLSMQPRFGGRLQDYYCVAQHSIECALLLPMELSLAGLLHDASEAYICDIPSPIKSELPEYYSIEERIMNAISFKFGVMFDDPEIKRIDKHMLELEWSTLVKNHNRHRLCCMSQRESEIKFLKIFNVLERKI